jgi:peptide methionine sulfoxide reductase MsrA
VGYAAGTKANPTYHDMGDHAECTQVEFDPEEISYDQVLDKFFEWHNPFRKAYARQYMSAVLFHNEQQRESWERIVAQKEGDKRKVHTEVQDYTDFTLAEDYHQKYYLRRNKTVALELKGRFPTLEEFTNATATMVANAILGGFLEPDRGQLEELGFSKEPIEQLVQRKKSFFGSLFRSVIPG